MSRIDVVHGDKGKFKVLVNFIQRGPEYSSTDVANTQAKHIKNEIPAAELRCLRIKDDNLL
jgi:hypothetical protein